LEIDIDSRVVLPNPNDINGLA